MDPGFIGQVGQVGVIVVLDNIRSLYNTGAFFRTADGCGVEKLVLCGITPRPDQGTRQRRGIAKTALGAEDSVAWEYEAEAAVAVAKAAAAGYAVAAIENSPQAVDLYRWDAPSSVCLVFGHETDGVAVELARGLTTHVRIPMRGQKRSLNVASAAAVVLYELMRRRMYASTPSLCAGRRQG
jgi:23S rRNA (guanosine2251-2'-O)-methyltransferase